MLFYGLVRDSTEEAVELFTTQEEAEAIVQAWDRAEPDQAAFCAWRRSSSGRERRISRPPTRERGRPRRASRS
jgi:hypothetical protein